MLTFSITLINIAWWMLILVLLLTCFLSKCFNDAELVENNILSDFWIKVLTIYHTTKQEQWLCHITVSIFIKLLW